MRVEEDRLVARAREQSRLDAGTPLTKEERQAMAAWMAAHNDPLQIDGCGDVFVARMFLDSWHRAQQPAPQVEQTANGMKECPFCAEDIKAAAIKCKHCGSVLPERSGRGVMGDLRSDLDGAEDVQVSNANRGSNTSPPAGIDDLHRDMFGAPPAPRTPASVGEGSPSPVAARRTVQSYLGSPTNKPTAKPAWPEHSGWILAIIGVLVAVIAIVADQAKHATATKGTAANDSTPRAKTRDERIQEQFSSWDGSHRGLEKAIKQSMDDPDSYKHVKTWLLADQGDFLVVTTEFRGKNAFGGVVTNEVTAKVDLDGNVRSIVSDDDEATQKRNPEPRKRAGKRPRSPEPAPEPRSRGNSIQ